VSAPVNTPGPETRGSGPIAYVNQFFPLLTETFVYREVLALRRLGLEIVPFSLRRPPEGKLAHEVRELAEECCYGIPFDWPWLLAGHMRYLVRRPFTYLRALAFVLTRPGNSLRTRGLTLIHFLLAGGMAREMERRGVVHVHAHFAINAATIALVAGRLLGIPFSFTAHNLLFTQKMLLPEKVREAHFVAAISEYTRRYAIDSVPAVDVAGRIHVVHCGIEASTSTPRTAPREPGLPRVLFVAQLAERKGVTVLIEACRILKERGQAFHCLVLGDGRERAVATELVTGHGLGEHVELGGAIHQEELYAHLDRADVFALPCVTAADGDVDGIPVSLMEAMARSVPVVSTTVSGIPELIEDGKGGLLIPPRDPDALADALQRLFGDPELRARLGNEGRLKVREAFDIDRSAARLAELFRASAGEVRR